MTLVTLITPTGSRPEALALCEHYITRQTFPGEMQWIIVDDSIVAGSESQRIIQRTPKKAPVTIEVYPGPKYWRPGINTQRYNLDEGIKHVKGEYVFVLEDDDFYKENYVEMQIYFLQKFDIVGQGNSHYYNVKDRSYKLWNNYHHTSLCETAFRKSKLDLLDRAINSGQLFFDVAFWQIAHNEKQNLLIYDHIGLMYGMKGLPGRVGIGGGHVPDKSFTRDPFFNTLREWIGPEDSTIYAKMAITKKVA